MLQTEQLANAQTLSLEQCPEISKRARVAGAQGNGLLWGREENVFHIVYLCRLDHCGLTPACCLVISQILVTSISLKSLSLVGNKVTNQGIKPLCDALTASQCTLQKMM